MPQYEQLDSLNGADLYLCVREPGYEHWVGWEISRFRRHMESVALSDRVICREVAVACSKNCLDICMEGLTKGTNNLQSVTGTPILTMKAYQGVQVCVTSPMGGGEWAAL
jgi:hypothetical protein